MNIVAPTNNASEVIELINTGADALYCGVVEQDWDFQDTESFSPNRRLMKCASLKNFTELRRVVDTAHKFSKKVQFCLNSGFTPAIFNYAKKGIKAGVDAIIIADMPSLNAVKQLNFTGDIIMSSGAGTMNSSAIQLFKKYGATQVILPRQMAIEEIKNIAADNSDVKIEFFMMNQGCFNFGCHCSFIHPGEIYYSDDKVHRSFKTISVLNNYLSGNKLLKFFYKQHNRLSHRLDFLHGTRGVFCIMNHKVIDSGLTNNPCKETNDRVSHNINLTSNFMHFMHMCGACSLIELVNSSVHSCKIVGREFPTQRKVMDIKFVKNSIEIASSKNSKQKKQGEIKLLYKKLYGYNCASTCYYSNQYLDMTK